MQKTMRIVANVFSIAVFLVMSINLAFFIFRDGIELFTIESPLVFAFLVAAALLVLIVLNLLGEVKKARSAPGAEAGKTDGKGGVLREIAPVAVFAAAIFLYIYLLRYLHFLAGSLIFVALGNYLLNETTKKTGHRVLWAGAASLIMVPILYLVFHKLFGVVLP